ncbi:MAG: hypothetical protein JWN30_2642, partial [Bacilli bacterium]|nr:hypothetical protein [Bacilli bacterium]
AVAQNKKLATLEQNLVASAQKTFDSLSQNVHVDALQVSPQFHSAAAKLGLPAGKYAFYLKANSDGHPVSIDELKTTSINKLESDYGIPHDFLKGETVQSLDVALQNSDQLDKGSKNTTTDTPAKTDGNSQNTVSTKTSVEAQHQKGDTNQSDTNQQPGTYTKPGKKTVSESSQADQHTNLFDIIKQKLHLTPQNKDYQDTQGKSDSQTNVPTISVPAKDQSTNAAANNDKTNTDNTKTDKGQSDKTHNDTTGGPSSINSGSDNEGTTAAGTTKANSSEAGDNSKKSDSHSSSDKTVKPIVKSSHTVNLNVGSHVYGNEKTSQHGGLLGALLNK